MACRVWFGVCSYMASAKGCTLDLPHSSAARRINTVTINHRHTFMYPTTHDGTGSSGEKGGAASRHCRIGRQTPFLHLYLPTTAPCPALSLSCPLHLDVRPAPTRRSVRSPHHHRTLALALEPGSRRLDVQ
jgi:hypothetical protein